MKILNFKLNSIYAFLFILIEAFCLIEIIKCSKDENLTGNSTLKSNNDGLSEEDSSDKNIENVIEINDIKKLKGILKLNKHAVIEIYSPHCGHCMKFKPEYEALAKKVKI